MGRGSGRTGPQKIHENVFRGKVTLDETAWGRGARAGVGGGSFFSLLHPSRPNVQFFLGGTPLCELRKKRKTEIQWLVQTGGPGGAEVLQAFPFWCLTLPGAS